METVLANRAQRGINRTLPSHNLIGAHANRAYSACYVYKHEDHRAVHDALFKNSFGVVYRAGATCQADPDATRNYTVSQVSVDAAWGPGKSFPNAYGWLDQYSLSQDQSKLFMRKQSFWIVKWSPLRTQIDPAAMEEGRESDPEGEDTKGPDSLPDGR